MERLAWPFRALQSGFDLAGHLLPKPWLPSLDADDLIAAAGAHPEAAAREGLRQLLAAIRKDTVLSLFGHLSLRWDMIRLLRNAERIESAHRDTPDLGRTVIAAPMFILGLPRSGTSFLHTLLAADKANLVPRNWQTIYPAPRPPDFVAGADRNARKVGRQLKLFAGLAPGFSLLHPIGADSPQECSEITSHVFQSSRFDTIFRVPDYLAWLEAFGHLPSFRFHKKFLQYLQTGLSGTWVLKCPDHTFSLDAILQVYPDARFIIVHRDPLDVLASVAHLTEVLRKPFLKNIDAAEIGRQVSERWIDGAHRLVAFDQRADIAAAQKINVHYHDLVADPLAAVARIYAHFGIPLENDAASAISRLLAARPRGGYDGKRRYAPGRFGINPESLARQFAAYLNYFNIKPKAS